MTDRLSALRVLTAFAAMLAAGVAWAQSPEMAVDPCYTNLSNYLIKPNRLATDAVQADPQSFAGGNVSRVMQTGSGNLATVDIVSVNNATAQTQSGDDNASSLSVAGSFNDVSSTQTGSGDSFSLALTGNANSVTQTQTGNNLSYGLTVAGSGKSVTITQFGGR